MLKGWIIADYEDKEVLEGMGIKLGEYSLIAGRFDYCEVPEEAMKVLDKHWGRYYWELH